MLYVRDVREMLRFGFVVLLYSLKKNKMYSSPLCSTNSTGTDFLKVKDQTDEDVFFQLTGGFFRMLVS